MPRDDRARIRDIVDACERIASRVDQLDARSFAADDTLIRAVLYDFIVIGEAAKGVSAESRRQYPSVPWSDMAGMRDVVAHQYFGIEVPLVWRAATVSVAHALEALRTSTQ